MINESQPLVSVIFTSYNHHEFLKQALDSIVDQTYSNLEVIVIDDNSSDGSQEILKEYYGRSNVSLHLLEKNTGSYVKASNYGIPFAKGEFLMFAQCDDYAAPEQIQELMKAFSIDEKIGVVYSRSNLVDEYNNILVDDFVGREKAFKANHYKNSIIPKHQMRDYLTFSCVIPNLSAAIIKKDLYIKAGCLPKDYSMAADWALWLNLSELTDFYYITKCLNNFRQHGTTIRSQTKIKVQIEEIYAIFYNHLKKYNITGKTKTKFKIGAASVWFAYFIENTKAAIISFPSVTSSLFKLEKFNLYYLFLGALKHMKEVLLKL
ncbi:glycosyltransferase [Pedobacter lithocola]|uniref:Glycosyltransferase n=1 Tax=Pedobacter lithocola TaxID=1908239 RepID=A0ABV8P6B8_9SPHI